MKLIQVLQAYPYKAFIPSRGGISGILKLLERKDPSMRISRKLETLVGRSELLTLHWTVVRHRQWYFVIRPGDHYSYLRLLCDFIEWEDHIRCLVNAVFTPRKIATWTKTIAKKLDHAIFIKLPRLRWIITRENCTKANYTKHREILRFRNSTIVLIFPVAW